MKYVKIKQDRIPAVMLGTWSWGTGIVGGNTIFGNNLHLKDLQPVYNKAIEEGLYAFDSAPVYGGGDAESILGAMIKDNHVFISTKFMPFYMQPRQTMARSLDKSLKRLKRKQADIFWVHVPRNVRKWTTELIPLMKKNKIRYAGVSNHNLQQIQLAKQILEEAGLELAAIQNHFSLLYLNCNDNGILDWCHQNDIVFFSYMVLEQGALTSRYNKEHPFPKNTRRAKAFPPETLKRIEPLINQLKELAIKYNVDVADIATAYAINKKTIPIVGVTKTHHIESIIRAIEVELLPEEITLLESTAKLTNVKNKGFWEKTM